MSLRLRPYRKMKDSGVPWLGQVPEHWELVPNKMLFRRRKETVGERHPEFALLSLTLGGIIERDIESGKGKFPSDFGTYQAVYPGDFVFCLFDVDETPRTVGLSTRSGMITGAYDVLKCTAPVPDFLLHYYSSLDERKALKPLYTGLRKVIPEDRFLGAKSPQPPRDEQVLIASYLNRFMRRTTRFIRNRRRLIGLLNEQKQAIIQNAVTRGLDPNVRLKPSGIEWLGDVPEHWEVPRVKQCARTISKGTTPSTEGREILDSGPVRFLKAENIAGGGIVDTPLCFINEETNVVLKRSQLQEGDVLFVIAGATLGKTAVVEIKSLPANTNQAIAFIRPNKRVTPTYLALWLQSHRLRELIWLNAVQSAQPNLSMADLGNFFIPLPPIKEQESILLWLKGSLRGPETAIERTHREIDLVREYRTRLIADVVTGKLDVRGVELPPLEEAEELPAEGDETLDNAPEEETELEPVEERADAGD